jgi:glycosyltransferase involved in cell wall biosynthesis
MRELPPKPERGHIYRGGRILHHIVKNMKNYPLVSDIDEYKEGINGFQALSDHVKNAYASFGFPENRIRVIPNILDEQFQIPHKSSFSEPIKLLYVGELKKHKGVDRLPHLLSELNKTADRDFELSIVGKGPLKHEIVEKGANMGLEEDMTVYGFMEYEKLPELYANHDIFVYLGRWQEPFGRVFLESLATGTPVVSTNVGAVSEIIGEGGEVGNGIDEVVAKIQSLSQSQLQEYSEYAKVRAKKFRQDDIVEEIERLYVEVN